MKKYVLSVVTGVLATTAGFASDEKPKVSLCQSEECAQAGVDSIDVQLQETRKKVMELAHNDHVVMKNFDTLASALNTAYHKEKSMTASEVQQVFSGIAFAAEKHQMQTRKNAEKTPYVSHPIAVACHLMEVGQVRETEVILGGLLHDTVEDTQTTFEEIAGKFSGKVATLVREVTDDKSLAKETRKRLQVINASHKSTGAAQIKLADKLCNLTDLLSSPPNDWTQARIDRYYEWAQSVVDRLPKANDKLHEAVIQTINTYWEKQAASKA